jgi:hypothetical protein
MFKSMEGWESANIIKMWKNMKIMWKTYEKTCVPPQYVKQIWTNCETHVKQYRKSMKKCVPPQYVENEKLKIIWNKCEKMCSAAICATHVKNMWNKCEKMRSAAICKNQCRKISKNVKKCVPPQYVKKCVLNWSETRQIASDVDKNWCNLNFCFEEIPNTALPFSEKCSIIVK